MDADKLRTLYEHRDEEFYEWRAFVEAIGIDATLDGLGFFHETGMRIGITPTQAVPKRSLTS
jgi:hypothetical protein